ncbi:MAG: hypothetical protein H6821_00335 [Planctomycetaceae bacterium]|nr:hypothetical protein [Planctomycetales bacterium]MCB9872597.1 hypothetical protein [Planctomycetaceae bacterium]MCB9939577.1 hypothetical protein [Planctomycetaceae bacterium]HRX77884.1 hypothetical protein [Pirellulaceae bacterium]
MPEDSILRVGTSSWSELIDTLAFNQGDAAMGDKGSKDKGKKEQQKKAQRTPKEKRALKNAKKNK